MTTTAVDAPPRPATPPTPVAPDPATTRGWRGWIQRPLVACLVLFSIYAGLSLLLNDPRGTLGTDTGGKLATLHVMESRGVLDPDVGYWAASADPHGTLHPLFYTYRINGQWVNVSTLPMLYAAYPLYLVGGDRGVLAIPMLAAVFAALAAGPGPAAGREDRVAGVLGHRPAEPPRDLRARLLGARPRARADALGCRPAVADARRQPPGP